MFFCAVIGLSTATSVGALNIKTMCHISYFNGQFPGMTLCPEAGTSHSTSVGRLAEGQPRSVSDRALEAREPALVTFLAA